MRALTGTISAVLAITLSIYLMLMILNIAPVMDIHIFNESFIKFIAQLTVFFYLVAAWAFWSI
jgi:succinate dehydrogenase hydrophobic anchor subunit